MIRTIPDPIGNADIVITVPREEMLKELGLD